ncbi:bactofilin family protein [Oceanibaculum sp.]|uniref:bactofilin family protein n=1 Tax=Oceanibaculum sp. TaxID=1903597 RepID=UPI002584010B|nr:polymer-forming cytoskeletal protein [Oceanibaculum sp.]MCH2393561.1 polymer-forming cytoskeletal protein [Oceanibaculum sp.]
MSTIKPSSPSFVPELPRRSLDIPGAGRRGEGAVRSNVSDSRRLTVGREIVLSGDITACEVLVVEGRVDAKLKNCQAIEITPSGVFKGEAEIEEADISGSFEGVLTVRGRLTVRNGGRIQGTVRYGQLEVEAGGEINGDLQSATPAKAEAKAAAKAEDRPTATP